jgi:CRP/FNR family transcriptional regulator, cyclic AMP receptor protein
MRGRIPREQLELLKTVPLFSACSTNELRSIAQLGTPVDADQGAYLTEEGKPGREFFLVLGGVASCRVHGREVKEFHAGDYFGELALLYGGLRTADVVSMTPMELLVFDAREFRSMLMATPRIGVKMLGNLAQRLTEADMQYTH